MQERRGEGEGGEDLFACGACWTEVPLALPVRTHGQLMLIIFFTYILKAINKIMEEFYFLLFFLLIS